jgi:hypothetical protein
MKTAAVEAVVMYSSALMAYTPEAVTVYWFVPFQVIPAAATVAVGSVSLLLPVAKD